MLQPPLVFEKSNMKISTANTGLMLNIVKYIATGLRAQGSSPFFWNYSVSLFILKFVEMHFSKTEDTHLFVLKQG